MSNMEMEEHIPEFDSAFVQHSQFFYFHQVVDSEAATLTVEVIGPNLSYTFYHSRAQRTVKQSQIEKVLSNKTTGFLSLVSASEKRIVLAWAESGHGLNKRGDLLDDGKPGVLSNPLWTRRVITIGKLMSLSMAHPYDYNGGNGHLKEDLKGVFLGSHVEVKLAVHAIFTLLNVFGIVRDLDKVTQEDLKKLRVTRWDDGSRPAFEIYFSRKNCPHCAGFVNRLVQLTGVQIQFVWRHRLIRKTYLKKLRAHNPLNGAAIATAEIEDMSFFDTDISEDEESADQDAAIETIDLTAEPRLREVTHPADNYIDGLAYCVGQMQESPDAAQSAVIHLAEMKLKKCRQPLPQAV